MLQRHYVAAGFTKIHIDTSMKVNSDPEDVRLSDEIIAGRGAHLAKVAEETYKELLERDPEAIPPVYVIGSEVPIPGGAVGAEDNGVQVTKVEDFKNTVAAFEKAFAKEGLPGLHHLKRSVISSRQVRLKYIRKKTQGRLLSEVPIRLRRLRMLIIQI